jgi:hypothetical protein
MKKSIFDELIARASIYIKVIPTIKVTPSSTSIFKRVVS